MSDQKTEATEPAETIYVGFASIDDEPLVPLKSGVSVPAGRADKAKQIVLAHMAEKHPGASKYNVAVVPRSSWKPESFTVEVPAPRFVPAD